MYVGVGTLVVILMIVLIIYFARRGEGDRRQSRGCSVMSSMRWRADAGLLGGLRRRP